MKCVVMLCEAGGKCWVCVLAMSQSQWLYSGYAIIRNKELRCTLCDRYRLEIFVIVTVTFLIVMRD